MNCEWLFQRATVSFTGPPNESDDWAPFSLLLLLVHFKQRAQKLRIASRYIYMFQSNSKVISRLRTHTILLLLQGMSLKAGAVFLFRALF